MAATKATATKKRETVKREVAKRERVSSRALNALTTGRRCHRLVIGRLPPELWQVESNAREYRRALEAATVEVRGEITLTDAHYIDAACEHSVHVAITRWILHHKFSTMRLEQILACKAAAGKAITARNRAVDQLAIDPRSLPTDGNDAPASLYAMLLPAVSHDVDSHDVTPDVDAESPQPPPPDARDAAVVAQDGDEQRDDDEQPSLFD